MICKLSLCDYCSRPRLCRAISSSRRAGGLVMSHARPGVPFPPRCPRTESFPRHGRIHACTQASRPLARHGHGLATVTDEEGRLPGP
jgi:hypothetical protein